MGQCCSGLRGFGGARCVHQLGLGERWGEWGGGTGGLVGGVDLLVGWSQRGWAGI